MRDVSGSSTVQGEPIGTRIELRFHQLDPPEGLVVVIPGGSDAPVGDPREFVGWLGLFAVLQSLADEVDRSPP